MLSELTELLGLEVAALDMVELALAALDAEFLLSS